jgi:bisanhydrobacterioruberin hydratase
MIKQKRIKLIILILFLVGFSIHLFCESRPLALNLTTPFLLLINVLLIYLLINNQGKKTKNKTAIFLSISFLITFILEIVGSKTGIVFGNYSYGDTMWLKIANVPVVIGLNWIILLVASFNVTQLISKYFVIKSILIEALLTASLLTFLDYFIEPIAIFLNYWNWEKSSIPPQNYLAWFIISFCLTICIRLFKIELQNKIMGDYFKVVLVYFVMLQIFLKPC